MGKEGLRVIKSYRVQEFAELAGVTVRALHHYDRLGLLKPGRSENGYRLYRLCDLERLEQIVALKFLGIPLKRIRTLLDRDSLSLPNALRMQRRVLEQRRRLLDRAIRAIGEAEKAAASGRRPEASLLKKIIEVIEMQDDSNWMMKYYNEEGKAKVEARRHLWSPELQERVSKEWAGLLRDVEAVLDQDPAGAPAQALARRWIKLVEEFTGGDPDITRGVGNLYADRQNWPAEFKERMTPFSNPRVWQFMNRAIAARR